MDKLLLSDVNSLHFYVVFDQFTFLSSRSALADNQTTAKDAGSPAPADPALEAEPRNDDIRDSG